jgi:hypothetical protein
MSSIIILTSTVNIKSNINCIYQIDKHERINVYIKSVLKWLNESNVNIILVENSGYDFSELYVEKELYKNRFEIISYNELELDESQYLINNISKGDSEIFAINYAFNNSQLIKEINPIFIIKITGRYFIPELENYLNIFNLNNYDCLSQFDQNRCEMVGCHYTKFNDIFNINTSIHIDYIEDIYKDRINNLKNILRCKEFKINATQRGGCNMKYNNI